MAKTYTPIATTTLGSATGTVTFSSIPNTYTDLVLVATRRFDNVTTGSQNTHIRFNGDTGSNYSNTYLAAGVSSGRLNSMNELYTSGPGNEASERYSVDVWNFFNYSNTTTYKTSFFSFMFAGEMNQLWTGLWRNTAAINTITITGSGSATFAANSMFTLYGIQAA